MFTNRMLFSVLIGTVCRCIHSYFNATGICTQYSMYVFPCTVYSLDHMCHQDPGWSQVDTDSLCKHHTRHWASWIDSQCTHTSTYKNVPVCKCKNTWVPQNDQYTLTQVYTSGICLATHNIRYYKWPYPLLFLAVAFGGITLTQSASKGQPSGLLIETVTHVSITHTLTITYIHTEISYSSLYVYTSYLD